MKLLKTINGLTGFLFSQPGQFYIGKIEYPPWALAVHNFAIEDVAFSSSELIMHCSGLYCSVCHSTLLKYIVISDTDYFDECSIYCHPLCNVCIASGNSDCVSCVDSINVEYKGTTCKCIEAAYYNSTSETCELCHPLCASCYGESNDMCN